MSYFAPYIDGTGLHIPSYEDIRDDLISQAKQIYGQDIYLGNDSQDYQLISAFALKTYDTMQLLQIIYNNRGPQTAIGSALDGIVKLNGIRRKEASYSTCVVKVTGDDGTIIRNGIVEDSNNRKWSLPELVIIGTDGYVEVSVICQEIGAIEAVPGSISKIVTPTKGWISVNNLVPAVPGQPIETDAQIRDRQAISVANPSQTLLDGTIGGIASVEGVRRYKVYENDTSIVDENGIPGHSIAAVVEGGLDQDVAEQIYLRKGIGGGTVGDMTVTYINADNLPVIISFYRPEYVGIDINLSLKRQVGYTAEIKQQIINQIKSYLNNLDIGNNVTVTGILAAILAVISNLSAPQFAVASLTIGFSGETAGPNDLILSFKQVASIGEISVTEV